MYNDRLTLYNADALYMHGDRGRYKILKIVCNVYFTLFGGQALPDVAHRVTNFDFDMRSGLVLHSLLINHWPDLAKLAGRIRLQPSTDAHRLENAAIVVREMEALQLPFPLTVCLSAFSLSFSVSHCTMNECRITSWEWFKPGRMWAFGVALHLSPVIAFVLDSDK